MKCYLPVLVAFLVMINVALGAVGDVGGSDTSTYLQPAQSLTGTASVGTAQSSGLQAQMGANVANVPNPDGSSIQDGYLQPQQNNYPTQGQQAYASLQGPGSAYSAPETGGPVQDQLTAEALRLSPPAAESFVPDESLNFVSTSSPGNMVSGTAVGAAQTALTGSSYWYYPGQVNSANRFYVQTSSGLNTIAGCSYGGYLPLFADIKSSGNFFVYEWYPGSSTPVVRLWGWTGTGYKKGWFSGDVPGWHTLCYNCGIWSNYIYIYVYPRAVSSSSLSYTSNPSYPVYTGNPGTIAQVSLPAGAPTPPDLNAERLAMPDNNLYRPITGQATDGTFYNYQAPQSNVPAASSPIQASYPGFVNYPAQQTGYAASGSLPSQAGRQLQANNPAIARVPTLSNSPALAGSTTATCTTCTSSTVVKEGVSSACPYPSGCPTSLNSGSLTAPGGYLPESYKAVYPRPSTCRCNEYYVQTYPGKLGFVAGVFSGEWLPLWSKISRPGIYWSYEWTMCAGSHGNYCAPEAKNFGYKSAGWYQTWFKGNEPGWHILSYQCNDWSNYVYIYVWPAD